MVEELTLGGLFTGVGGIELGLSKSNTKTLWVNDFDKNAHKTYKKNFNTSYILDDIKNISGEDLDSVDILSGGFPCQPFSIAGYQKGFEDTRGNVFFEIIRLINELKNKPRVLLLENVKNFYTHDKGNTFKTVKELLESNGYSVYSNILNTTTYTQIPHNRERTFIICFLDNKYHEMKNYFETFCLPTPAETTHSISEFLETDKVDEKYYYREDKYMYGELVGNMKDPNTVYQWRRKYVRENKSGVCPTLTANMGTGGHNVPLILVDDGIRKLTPRECFNLQGFPSDFDFPDDVADTQLYKQSGNSVTVTLIEKLGRGIRETLEKFS
tara:strand:+ start:1922 stop:2902 length:981 start_codon:yes stop_codon:yes gene_type:complete